MPVDIGGFAPASLCFVYPRLKQQSSAMGADPQQLTRKRLLPQNVVRCASVKAELGARFGVKVKIFGLCK